MVKVFEIYLYICGGLISLAILFGLVALLINLYWYFRSTLDENKQIIKAINYYNLHTLDRELTEKDIKR